MNLDLFSNNVNEMRPMMKAIARRILNDEDDVEDVVQDALLRLWELRDESVRNIEDFAKVMVRHMCIDRLRTRHPHVPIEGVEVPTDVQSDGLNDDEERIMKMIRELPTVQQTILRMRHVDEIEYSKIAETIGLTEQAVRQLVSRSRRSILKRYELNKMK
jgi:RNA polymerase sigma-70 factor (ECF subfamily)